MDMPGGDEATSMKSLRVSIDLSVNDGDYVMDYLTKIW